MTSEPSAQSVELPAAQAAYRKIMELLLSGQFHNGEAIRENLLSQQFDLGRGAVREALNRLVSLGALDYTPYCGYRLRPYTMKDRLDWYDFRIALEPRALAVSYRNTWKEREKFYAVMEEILNLEVKYMENNDLDGMSHTDYSFHLKIVEASANPLIINSYLHTSLPFLASCRPSAAVSVDESLYYHDDMSPYELERTHESHEVLLKELSSGNPDHAVELLRQHITFSRNSLYDFMARRTMAGYPVHEQSGGITVDDIIGSMLPAL